MAARFTFVFTRPRATVSHREYAIEFRTLAAETGWEGEALVTAFYQGLREAVNDEMVNRDWGEDLDDLITLATALDKRMRERRRERREFHPLLRQPGSKVLHCRYHHRLGPVLPYTIRGRSQCS